MYDVLVLGGGTAGLRGALTLANAGKNVALFEPGTLGGTCLNTGCIPSKALLHAARRYHEACHSSHLGISGKPHLDFPKLLSRVRKLVKEGTTHISATIRKPTLTLVREPARFVGRMTVEAGGKRYQGKKIIIATGARNFTPPIPGLEEVEHYTNENILTIPSFPKRVILIGGGYISMEYATFFLHLGCRVTVVEASPCLLGMLDEDIRAPLEKAYRDGGAEILLNARVSKVAKQGGRNGHIAVSVGRRSLLCDALVVATGRIPNTASLNLKAAGVRTDDRGFIPVDAALRTSHKNIYAVGDIVSKGMFAHAAKREIQEAVSHILGHRGSGVEFSLMPWAVFTHPVVSGVGLSEKQAREKKLRFSVSVSSFSRVGRAAIEEESGGFVKIIHGRKGGGVGRVGGGGRILGAMIVGARADDLIHEIVAVMNSSSPTLHTLQKTIHVHPTLSEVMNELEERD